MARVVHIREVPSGWKENPDYVYIGRPGKGLDGYFGNPVRLKKGEPRGSTIEKYRAYFYARIEDDEDFRQRVLALKDKVLVCFCKPNPCHGDVIVEYLGSLPPEKSE